MLVLGVIAALVLLVGILIANQAASPPSVYLGLIIIAVGGIGLVIVGVVELVRW